MGPTVVEALRRHADGFRQRHPSDPVRLRVLDRVLACRTGALGGHVLVCDACGLRTPVYKSCDDRHCPQCGTAKSGAWFEERAARMLSVPHFQVVLTLPSELRAVAHRNPDVVYPLMARTGASVLADLAEQRLGARLGITAVLHTWASDLTLHPHWHLLVTAGGLSLDGERWVSTRTDFLFPVAILGKMYRGRLLQGLIGAFERGELDLGERAADFERTLRLVAKRHRKWGVYVEPPGDRPVGPALKYLARYVHRVAISDPRVIAVTDTTVGFWARDRDSGGKQRKLWLDGPEFVRRFLLHVLPKGLRKTRHYGLYASSNVPTRLEQARTLLPDPPPDGIPSDLEAEAILSRCERLIARAEHRSLDCPQCGARRRTEPLPRPPHTARGPP